MPFEYSWYVPRRVIYIRLNGDISVAELAELKEATRTLATEGDAPVHAIIDTLSVTSLPHDLPGIFRAMTAGDRPLEGAFSVLVSTHRLAQFLSVTLFQLLKLEFRIAPSLTDAFEILARIDRTIQEADTSDVLSSQQPPILD